MLHVMEDVAKQNPFQWEVKKETRLNVFKALFQK